MEAETRETETHIHIHTHKPGKGENSVQKKMNSGLFLPLLKQSTQSDEKKQTQKCLSITV